MQYLFRVNAYRCPHWHHVLFLYSLLRTHAIMSLSIPKIDQQVSDVGVDRFSTVHISCIR